MLVEISQAVVVAEGEAHIAQVPSGKLIFGRPFTVQEGQTTVVTIDFDGQRSVHLNGEGDYILTPEVKLLVDEPLSDGDESSGSHHYASGQKLEIEGVIKSFSAATESDGQLMVGDLTIIVTPETEWEGTPYVNGYVDVEVIVEDGIYTAVEVEVKEEGGYGLTKVEIEGPITVLDPNTWMVGDYTVHLTGDATWYVGGQSVTVTTNAEIEGEPRYGYTAEVEGLLIGPGLTLLALEIEVEDDGDEDEREEERDHVELDGVIEGLYGTQGSIDSLSEQDLEGQNWSGDVTITLKCTAYTINQDTEIEGTIRNGVAVEMKFETAADGTRYVTKIEVEDDEEDDEKNRVEEGASETREDREEEPDSTSRAPRNACHAVELTGTDIFAVAAGTTFFGNIHADETWDGTITSKGNFHGNIKNMGDGTIDVTVPYGDLFNGNIKNQGDGDVIVVINGQIDGNIENKGDGAVNVSGDGTLNGNIKNEGHGDVTVVINGQLDGNIENKGDGAVDVSGEGTLNGNVRNEGSGTCAVTVAAHGGDKEGNCT